MTEPLFRNDPYQRETEATVMAINERGGIILDRSIFYPTSGGQPGDTGTAHQSPAAHCPIATTVYDADRDTIVHRRAEGSPPRPSPATRVTTRRSTGTAATP